LSTNDPSLSNRDLAPTTPEQRTWGLYNYTALWFSMCMEITTYQLASGLIAKGMDWKQAVGTVLLGNLIVLVPMLLNAHAGAKYGIPFPVFIRAPFGVVGANIPAILRAVVACGWFGIQSWIGGTAIYAMLEVIWPSVASQPAVLWASFLGFWLLNMVVVWRGVESIRHLQAIGAPLMFVMAGALLFWVHSKAGSFGTMLSTPSQFTPRARFSPSSFRPSLPWSATGPRSRSTFPTSRATPSRKAARPGDRRSAYRWPWFSTHLWASPSRRHRRCCSAIPSGIRLCSSVHFISRFVAFIALIGILISTLNVNLGANVVSPSNDFSNLYPRLISFRTGGMITGLLGLAMCPWKLLATPDAFIFGWLIGYSGLMGPVAGIMIADYFLIRKTELDVNSLYHREGVYHYTKGFNPRAVIALAAGVGVALIGHFVSSLHFLYDYAWFVGFFVAGIVYLGLMRLAAPVELEENAGRAP
jgi:NCS1 family nucleobase:cation symporter-1